MYLATLDISKKFMEMSKEKMQENPAQRKAALAHNEKSNSRSGGLHGSENSAYNSLHNNRSERHVEDELL